LGEKILVSLTGVSLRGMNPNEKGDFMVGEIDRLIPFKDTRYASSRMPSIREWLQGREGNINETRSFNWDYDLKRKPVFFDTNPNGNFRFHTTPYRNLDELIEWKDSYFDFKRGTRDGNRQIGCKNKLCTPELVKEFLDYVRLREAKIKTIGGQNANTNLRIFVNLLKRLKGWGYKRIGTELGISHSKVKYWIKIKPMSDDELRGGVICELISNIDSQITPPELVDEIFELWRVWTREDRTIGSVAIPQNSVIVELQNFLDNVDESMCCQAFRREIDISTSGELRI